MKDNNCIYKPSPDQTKPNRTEKLYCSIGDHEFLDEENNPRLNIEGPKVLAKSIVSQSGGTKYLIKIGAHGRIFNPIGMYSEGKQNNFLAKIGKNEWSFKEVPQLVFDQYVNFLRTKNLAWLNNAERGLA